MMRVVSEIVTLIRNAGYANVYENRLPAKVNQGIVIRFVTSVALTHYMDGTKAEDITYQVIVRNRSEREANETAEALMDFIRDRIPTCKGCVLIGNKRDMLPQELQLSESGYYETMIQFVAETITY